MSLLRVVLDTNVLVSALLFRQGSLTWLRLDWQGGRLRPLISRATTSELLRVLAYPKFRLSAAECEDLLADYLPFCETVSVADPVTVPDSRDPFDRPFLELALAGNADALVTGDQDLLTLAGDFPVAIVTPAAFRERMKR